MRNRVQVKATITPAIPDIDVYFKCFDVDDPNNGSIIDTKNPHGPNTGPDNYGGTTFGFVNNISTDSTNSDGEAFVGFYVTKQPGDNFRVAASTDQTVLADVNQVNIEYNDPNAWPLGAYVSPTLTVWRLWILSVRRAM